MIALLSDIHSNLPALQAVLTDAKDNGCDEFISLGDVVGYGAQPGECIDLLRECGAVNVLGNHDSYLIGRQKCSRSKVVAGIIEYQRNIVTGGIWIGLRVPCHFLIETTLCLFMVGQKIRWISIFM
ncbi:metallophosphoesterase family protein [Melaminivora jejuensis]|uniref:metallophosphoesterase family protein n=1 Tax=Melaminivora jejuensis TaxID=1267217 RepID=UPI001AE01778|nr:metallophosphoesterase family protein [Melaminivora jejuensis]